MTDTFEVLNQSQIQADLKALSELHQSAMHARHLEEKRRARVEAWIIGLPKEEAVSVLGFMQAQGAIIKRSRRGLMVEFEDAWFTIPRELCRKSYLQELRSIREKHEDLGRAQSAIMALGRIWNIQSIIRSHPAFYCYLAILYFAFGLDVLGMTPAACSFLVRHALRSIRRVRPEIFESNDQGSLLLIDFL